MSVVVRLSIRNDPSTGGLENLVADVLDADGEVVRTTQLGIEAPPAELHAMKDAAVDFVTGVMGLPTPTIEGIELLPALP